MQSKTTKTKKEKEKKKKSKSSDTIYRSLGEMLDDRQLLQIDEMICRIGAIAKYTRPEDDGTFKWRHFHMTDSFRLSEPF